MACVLVHIEVTGDQPSPAALSALGDARRIATALGAALYAAVVVTGAPAAARRPEPRASARAQTPAPGPPPITGLDDDATDRLVAALGRGGADKVVLIVSGTSGPAIWSSMGPALAAACNHLHPALIMFPATPAAADIAPRLAARLGAAFAAHAVVELGPRGEVVFSRNVYGGGYRRRLALDDLDRPVVVTVPIGHAGARGGDDAELLIFDLGADRDRRVEAIGEPRPAPSPPLREARVIVTGGAGVAADTWPLLERLAAVLGGAVGGTRAACERGLVGAEREVGLGAQYVAPVLYVACGASGSAGHLGAISPDAEIVAIDRDPDAPIFRSASYGLVGPIEDVIPTLLAALERA